MRAGSALPSNIDAAYQQAIAAMEIGEPERAVKIFKGLLTQNRNDTSLLFPYAIALYQTGSIKAAVKKLKLVFRKEPKNGDAAYNLGLIAQEAGDLKLAEKAFLRAVTIMPSNPQCHIMLGNILAEQEKLNASIEAFNKALLLDNRNVEAWYGLAMVMRKTGDIANAHKAAIEALNINPSHVDARIILAAALHHTGETVQALEHLQKLVVAEPDNVTVHLDLGNLAMNVGDNETALVHVRRALELQHDCAGAYYTLSRLIRFKQDSSDFRDLEAAASQYDPDGESFFYNYALFKAYQDIGDNDKAFPYLHRGSVQKRKIVSYDAKRHTEKVDQIISVFDQELLASVNPISNPEKTFIFILGMPRSGTTLTEQILTSHSQVTHGGELPFLSEYAAGSNYPEAYKNAPDALYLEVANLYTAATAKKSGDSPFFTDKAPGNFMNIGLILSAFPNAKIIHCRRDPVDTCLSCYKLLFGKGVTFSYDMVELGQHYLEYVRLMKHWDTVAPGRILNIDYEETIGDTEAQVARMLDYCGLPFEEKCLRFYENERPVFTASLQQVRKPIYKSSVGLWRKHEKHLQPLLEILEPVLY